MTEAIVERENMLRAYARVTSNKGSPGVDGMHAERHAALQDLLNVLLSLRQAEPLDRFAFAYCNLCDWIQAQLNGCSYAEIIRGKAQLELDSTLPAGKEMLNEGAPADYLGREK